MADKKLMVDSTVLIDYFRKTDKRNSSLVKHSISYNKLFNSDKDGHIKKVPAKELLQAIQK